jgi:hypothetical protein
MNLITFFQEFLPDYEIKRNEAIVRTSLKESDTEAFARVYFSDALQNFADRICEAQRMNCANEAQAELADTEPSIDQCSVAYAKQPRINELLIE